MKTDDIFAFSASSSIQGRGCGMGPVGHIETTSPSSYQDIFKAASVTKKGYWVTRFIPVQWVRVNPLNKWHSVHLNRIASKFCAL